MRLPRMTVRRWMMVVALLALSLGVVRFRQRRAEFLRVAAYNASRETLYREDERAWKRNLAALQGSLQAGNTAADREITRACQMIQDDATFAALFAERRRIFERLACHPWESVPLDPLEKKKRGREGPPVLIFETSPGRAYEFSTGAATRLALAPVAIVFGYVAFRLTTRRHR